MAEGFIDEARINVRAGDGGAGSPAFDRKRGRAKGGPDGGDGGRGGSIRIVADAGVDTLGRFRKLRHVRAEPGGQGGPNRRKGADAPEVRLAVPPGTIVRDALTGEMLSDLASPGSDFVVAAGGRPGRGNASIASGRDRAPNFAERGEPGAERDVVLDLRLVADVGLLGAPNAGKSTLLRAISNATPEVGDYPFTTLTPHLGVVEASGERFTVADLPGLIEGASAGRGLGTRFLRHASRCLVLAMVVDSASDGAEHDLDSVLAELGEFDAALVPRACVVVANKTDLASCDVASVADWAAARGLETVAVSALEREGTDEVSLTLGSRVALARAAQQEPATFQVYRPVEADRVSVGREGAGYRVKSSRALRAVEATPLENPRAVRYLQRKLAALGVESALAASGAQPGDEVFIGEFTFEYHPEQPRRSRRRRA
jgi:GTP-binding protein